MKVIIPSIIFLQSVDSTNNYAMAQVHAGLAKHGMAWFANDQYAGKGQRDKQWTASPGENITMSIALQPAFLEPSNQFQLSVTVAVAVHDFFSKYAGDETKIKWPNDLYWRDRKAGGILIENIIGTDSTQLTVTRIPSPTTNYQPQTVNYKWAIVGIGININQTSFPESLPNPVSLKQITGKDWEPLVLAEELHQNILTRFEQLKNEGFDVLLSLYRSQLYQLNQPQKFKKENRIFDATVKSVTPSGQLVLQHATEEFFNFGDIEWIITKK